MDSVHVMDNFCPGAFWNETLSWNTNYPDLTSCFQSTVLIWVPCAFIWVTSPFVLLNMSRSRGHFRIPWTLTSILKQLFCSLLIIMSFIELTKSTIDLHIKSSPYYPVSYTTPLVQVTTFVLVFALMGLNRVKRIDADGIIFLFWLLSSIGSLITYRSIILSLADKDNNNWILDTFNYAMKIVSIPLIIIELVLSFFSERLPSNYAFPGENIDNLSPQTQASFPSTLTYHWLNPMILLGYKRPLVFEDLYDLPSKYSSSFVLSSFKSKYQVFNQVNSSSNSITMPLFKHYKLDIALICFLQLINTLLQFVSPIMLDKLLVWMVHRDHVWQGIFFALVIFTTSVFKTMLQNNYWFKTNMVAVNMRTIMTCLIYDKSLKLSPESRAKYTTGQVVNIMSVDGSKVVFFLNTINMAWTAPLSIFISLYLLWQQLGPYATLAGSVIMVIVIPINGWIMRIWKKSQIKMMKFKDDRSKKISEMLNGMKVIKLYGWELSFTKAIKGIRDEEMNQLRTQSVYMTFVGGLLTATPIAVALVSFITFILVDKNNVLTASRAFVSLSLFNILRMPLSFAPMVITQIAQFSVSMKRINDFLNAEEGDKDAIEWRPQESSRKDDQSAVAAVVNDGTFSWTKSGDAVLKDINICIPKNKLVAVVGTVGSGKSSLLSALLGDTYKVKGSVVVNGSVAYVPQQAWIQNATLKNNVLFKSHLDESKYQKILSAAALEDDLKVLPAGDQTEIGEKGINLSGGQKQRVSLARAVYANRDIYLLDDPLSAVDSHVGKHIFDEIISKNGLLKDRTRILVTHKVSLLPQVDLILVVKDGKVSESGTYHELLDAKGAFSEFLIEYLVKEDDEDEESNEVLDEVKRKLASELQRAKSVVSNGSNNSVDQIPKDIRRTSSVGSRGSPKKKASMDKGKVAPKKPAGRLTEREVEQIGTVSKTVYIEYFKAAGLIAVIGCILVTVATSGLGAASNFWLTAWSTDGSNPKVVNDTDFRNLRIGVYAGLGLTQSIVACVSTFLIFVGTLKASKTIHNAMIDRIVKAPISYFDTTPVGRIMNRFTKDIDSLDTSIRMNFKNCLSTSFTSIIAMVVITTQTPIFLLSMAPLAVIYYVIQKIYIPTSRQLNRIESNTKSPIYGHFAETIQGVHCIRAFDYADTFSNECMEKVDTNLKAYILYNCSGKWVSVRLEVLGAIIVLLAATFAITNFNIDAATAGLIISYALTITNILDTLVRSFADLENNLVAVERCLEYTRITTEADWYNELAALPFDWPSKGVVKFVNYSTKYREGLEIILKNISFETGPGEKVGIVGRTGAGKSSLTLALLRLIEPVDGTIVIDDVDIRSIGLMDIRTRLTIIPQDPVLFTGTVRNNLDPFDTFVDEDLFRVLELVHLKDFIMTLEGGLEYKITEGGDNLSVGQRQLICLGRALLRKSKVIILDEATAAVDLETDSLIQDTIRKQFTDSTILTIAHRLNTILDYDRVLVLDDGKVAEYDTPNNLLQNTSSLFHSLAKDAKLV